MSYDRLVGTPIPEQWTRNEGATRRPLEVGMEVRIGGAVMVVDKAGPSGAVVASTARVPIVVDGHEFVATGRTRKQISVFAEVEYRKAGVDSEARRMVRSERQMNNRDRKENDMTTKSKVSAMPIAGKQRSKGKAARPGASAKGGAKTKAKAKASTGELDCLCGCGGKTARYFVPGHDARFKGWLNKIKKGEGKPSEFMPASLVRALGPWKDKGDGRVPSKSYRDLRD